MKKFKSFVFAIAVLLAISGLAQAGSINILEGQGAVTQGTFAPTITGTIGGSPVDLTTTTLDIGGGSVLLTAVNAEETFRASLTGNPDPFIIWSTTFNNTANSSPQAFTVDFSQPFFGGPYTTLNASVAGGGSHNPSSPGGVNITGIEVTTFVDATAYQQIGAASLAGNLDTTCTGGLSRDCNYNDLNTAISTGATGTLMVHFAATAGANDVVQYHGTSAISGTQIPEPGTVILLGSGLLGLAWLKRKQAR